MRCDRNRRALHRHRGTGVVRPSLPNAEPLDQVPANSVSVSSRAPMTMMRSPGWASASSASPIAARSGICSACLPCARTASGQPVGAARPLDRAALVDGIGQIEAVVGRHPARRSSRPALRPSWRAGRSRAAGTGSAGARAARHGASPEWRRSCRDCARNRRSPSLRRPRRRSRAAASGLRTGASAVTASSSRTPSARVAAIAASAFDALWRPGTASATSWRSPSASIANDTPGRLRAQILAHEVGAGAVEAVADDLVGRDGFGQRADLGIVEVEHRPCASALRKSANSCAARPSPCGRG